LPEGFSFIAVSLISFIYFHVVTPGAELKAIVTKGLGFLAYFFNG
jgi:hypothetical protein